MLKLPYIIWKDNVLFPSVRTSIALFGRENISRLNRALDSHGQLAVLTDSAEGSPHVGCLAQISDYEIHDAATATLSLQGSGKLRLLHRDEIFVAAETFAYIDLDLVDYGGKVELQRALATIIRQSHPDLSDEQALSIAAQMKLNELVHQMCFSCPAPIEDKLNLLADNLLLNVFSSVSVFFCVKK